MPIKKLITPGNRFGLWIAIEEAKKVASGKIEVKCRCDCGKVSQVNASNLRTGISASCGCGSRLRAKKHIEIGAEFGGWLVISEAPRGMDGKLMYRCRCICGNEAVITGYRLGRGYTKSCGCLAAELRTTHGHTARGSQTSTYKCWASMMRRCFYKKKKDYKNYGGRGITVCERWRSFENFLADMGNRPDAHTLDRYPNNDGNYEPGNCRWATRAEQSINRRSNRTVEMYGESLPVSVWAKRMNIKAAVIINRLNSGWSVQCALTTPVRYQKSRSR